MILIGHQLAVRKIRFSPYHANIIASSSYDMSIKIWDCNVQRTINQFEHHTEFVTGLDFNLFVENQLASASWDKVCSVFSISDNAVNVANARKNMGA
jgi:peroxin-7